MSKIETIVKNITPIINKTPSQNSVDETNNTNSNTNTELATTAVTTPVPGPSKKLKLKKIGVVGKKKCKFMCVICQKTFQAHNLLLTHFRMHGRNEIDLKGRPMFQSTLLKHPKCDQSIELVECEWCPEAFPNISKAIEHKFRKHRYESTNYFCKLCGKLFPLKVALNHHMEAEHKLDVNHKAYRDLEQNSDDKTLAFKCSYCSVGFATVEAIEFHEKGAHQMEQKITSTIVPPPSKKIKINNANEIISFYYCHLCGAEYILKYNLRKHLDDCHTLAERNAVPVNGIIKCKACEAIFYNNKAYTAHNALHKPDDLYVTSEEQRQKLVTRVDQDFDISRVPFRCMPQLKTKPKSQQKPSSSVKRKQTDFDDDPLSPVSIISDSSDD